MLDRHKVFSELQKTVAHVFYTTHHEQETIRKLWQWLIDTSSVAYTIRDSQPHLLPEWHEPLSTACLLPDPLKEYTVVSVDGSQIYPDRHQGIACFLLNMGIVHLGYTCDISTVYLDSAPSLHTAAQKIDSILEHQELSTEYVNCLRGQRELEIGLKESVQAREKNPQAPVLFMCDGTLLFWHLVAKNDDSKQNFLLQATQLLDDFYQARIPLVGYISLPNSKEVLALLRVGTAQKLLPVEQAYSFEYITDKDIFSFLLKPFTRSALFSHNSSLAQHYSAHSRPYFMYINTGDEIARLEFPAWVAQDAVLLETTLAIIADQCAKGRGYPVALAEAHEQAVVKGIDREYFYQLLNTFTQTHNQSYKVSQKSIKKRRVAL